MREKDQIEKNDTEYDEARLDETFRYFHANAGCG